MANTSCKFKQVKKGPIFCSWLCVMLPNKPCTSINLYTYQQIKTGKLLLFHVCMKMLPRSIMILRNLFKSVKPRGKLQVLCEPQAPNDQAVSLRPLCFSIPFSKHQHVNLEGEQDTAREGLCSWRAY